jgi:hypothetical protein
VYFDFHYYRKVLLFTWAQKQWPGRNAMLLQLLLVVPILTAIQAAFFLLDYLLFPALWRQEVIEPVFIVGHARSGTTLMHRLMAADGERFSYFLYWEMFFPSLTQKKLIRLLGQLDQRLLGAAILKRLAAWDERTFAPFRHMHDMSLWNPEEDQFVMKSAFVTQQWSLELPLMHEVDIFHIDRLSARRRRRWMGFYRECVKRQLLLNGSHKTHLSKNPIMSGWVNALLDTFPDARIVVMVRDPIQCIPSTLKLVETYWQSKKWSRAEYQAAQRTLTEISFDTFDLPREALASRAQTPHCFVDYRDLTSAPKKTVETIYQALGLDVSSRYESYLAQQEEKEKGHASHFSYSIDDYEIRPQEIEARLATYYEQYHWPKMSEQREQEPQ